METLIKIITEKTGISHDQATTAIKTVAGFLKEKLPTGIGNQVDSLINGGDGNSFANLNNDLKDKIGDIFTK